MIPVSLPSPAFFVLLSLSAFAGLLLIGWLLLLAVVPGMRRAFGKYVKSSSVLLLTLALLASFSAWVRYEFWQIGREIDRQVAALHVTLEQPARLGGIDMPAGTKLELTRRESLESFKAAQFPHPVLAYGIQAAVLTRYVSTDYDSETYATKGTYPTSVKLQGEGSQTVQGWHCDTTQPVEFEVQRDASVKAFDACVLAPGNLVADQAVPAGSTLRYTGGTMYGDGFRDKDRWQIRVESAQLTTLLDLPMNPFTIRLDAQRNVLAVDDAILACDTTVGPMQYLAGTMVESAKRGLREQFPGARVFSPADGHVARHKGYSDVPDGMSIIQLPSGEVAAIVTNAQAGVFRFARFVVDGGAAETPKRVRCPG